MAVPGRKESNWTDYRQAAEDSTASAPEEELERPAPPPLEPIAVQVRRIPVAGAGAGSAPLTPATDDPDPDPSEPETESAPKPALELPKPPGYPLIVHTAVLLFNRSPEAGLLHLLAHGCITDTPAAIAKFVTEAAGLSRLRVGDYLSDMTKPAAIAALQSYAEGLQLVGLTLPDALRTFLAPFHLPASRVACEAVMQVFATRYFEACPGRCKSQLEVLCLAFAAMMLNAEIHGERTAVPAHSFITKVHKAHPDVELDVSTLRQVHASVTAEAIRPDPDHTDTVRAVFETFLNLPDSDCGVEQWCLPHRFFVGCYPATLVVDSEKPTPKRKKRRVVYVFSDVVLVCKRRKDGPDCQLVVPMRHTRARLFQNHLYQSGVTLYTSYSGQVLLQLELRSTRERADFASVVNALELQLDFEMSPSPEVLDELAGSIDGDEGDGRLELYLPNCNSVVLASAAEQRVGRLDGVMSVVINPETCKATIKYEHELIGPFRVIRFVRALCGDPGGCYLYSDRPTLTEPTTAGADGAASTGQGMGVMGATVSVAVSDTKSKYAGTDVVGTESDDSDDYVGSRAAAEPGEGNGAPAGSSVRDDGDTDSDGYSNELGEPVELNNDDNDDDSDGYGDDAAVPAPQGATPAGLRREAARLELAREKRERLEHNRQVIARLEAARSQGDRSDPNNDIGKGSYYSPEDSVFEAANVGDTERIILLLNGNGIHVDTRDRDGRTPLMHAVHHNQHVAVELLITRNANVNHTSSIGATALHEAAFHGDGKLVARLIQARADVNRPDQGGRSPLHWATDNPSVSSLRMLLAVKEVTINAVAVDGMTAAMYAAYNDRPGHLECLLASGADLEEKDIDGKTAMHWAVHRKNAHCLERLLTISGTFFKDKLGRTVAHAIAEQGGRDALQVGTELRPTSMTSMRVHCQRARESLLCIIPNLDSLAIDALHHFDRLDHRIFACTT